MTFAGHLNFPKVTFAGHLNFPKVTFAGHLNFPKVTFACHLNFSKVTFDGRSLSGRPEKRVWLGFVFSCLVRDVPLRN